MEFMQRLVLCGTGVLVGCLGRNGPSLTEETEQLDTVVVSAQC